MWRRVVGVAPKLIPTGVAAQAIGVDRGTLVRWWHDGVVKPAMVTPGGHARWDLDDLLQQLRDLRQRDE
jgi:predicted site-specific integrase-resolvase